MAQRLREQEIAHSAMSKKYALPPHRISTPTTTTTTTTTKTVAEDIEQVAKMIDKTKISNPTCEKVPEEEISIINSSEFKELSSFLQSTVKAVPTSTSTSTSTSAHTTLIGVKDVSLAFHSSVGVDLTCVTTKSLSGIISEVHGKSEILTDKHIHQLESVCKYFYNHFILHTYIFNGFNL